MRRCTAPPLNTPVGANEPRSNPCHVLFADFRATGGHDQRDDGRDYDRRVPAERERAVGRVDGIGNAARRTAGGLLLLSSHCPPILIYFGVLEARQRFPALALPALRLSGLSLRDLWPWSCFSGVGLNWS